MVENNQVYEAAPTDLEDQDEAGRARGFASKATLAVASGIAMAGGMLMGNQMIVPALLGGADAQGNVQILNANHGDAANASELSAADQKLLGQSGAGTVFAAEAGAAFKKTAFGASDRELAAVVAAVTKSTDGSNSSVSSVSTQTTSDPAGKTETPVVIAPPPTWDTTATNTSSATTVAGGSGTGAGTGGSGGGSYEDRDGDHEDQHQEHEDDNDD